MTKVFFTKHGLKVVSLALGLTILGLLTLCGVIGAIAFPAIAGDTVEKDMNWLGEIVSLLMIIPGATAIVAWNILDEQRKKLEREERLARRNDRSLGRYPI